MAVNTSALAHLLINRDPEQLELPWATVEVVTPVIMVRMATGPALPVTTNAAGPLVVGDRVWCVWHKRALTICASPSQAARIQSLVSGMGTTLTSLTGRVGALEGRATNLENARTNTESAWSTWPVSWRDGDNGTALAIGDGTLEGRYKDVGKTVDFAIYWTRGDTTNQGTTFYTFDLPFAARNWAMVSGHGYFSTEQPVTVYPISTMTVGVLYAGARWSRLNPTSAVGHRLFITGTYERG